MGLFKKITTQEKRDFVKTLALLLKSGTPINEAFETLFNQARSPALKEVLIKAKERTEKGTPINEVFEDDPNFEKAFSSFIKAGEESGTLDKNLNYLADWLERKQTLEREISSATLYPKIVLTFSIILGGGLTFFVLPRLVPIFSALDIELPFISQLLLDFSNFIQNHGIDVILGTIILGLIFYLLSKIEKLRIIFDDLILKVPFIGDFIKDYQLTIISQLISTLFGSGIMVTKILDITAESVPNRTFKRSLEYTKSRVIKGDPFSMALNEFPNLYPSIYISIVTIGEETGSFTESFTYLADFFSTTITDKTKKIPVILEPLILILIGVFVAFIASAIILPIYQVTGGLY